MSDNQETIDKIDTGDLAGGGKKAPAHFGDSFLKVGSGVALSVSEQELEFMKAKDQMVLVRAEKSACNDDCTFLVMQADKVHGVCCVGPGFEITKAELQLTESLHGISPELAKTLWPESDVLYGYRILEKNFEGEPIQVEVTITDNWIAEVKPYVEKKKIAIDVFKSVTEDRVVAAAVLVPNKPDLHGDIYDENTVRAAAFSFMENYFSDNEHGINVMHKDNIINKKLRVLQSFVLDVETTYECELSAASDVHLSKARSGVTYPVGTWIMYARILDNDLWEDTKAGEFTGWSIQGVANIENLSN